MGKEFDMDSNLGLISIIVPVYKTESYLDECVNSIVQQTYSNIEIILVDDGSPDRSPQMCDEWAKRDSRVTVIHQENGGISSARNSGLEIARGEYIGFVDSDDVIATDMYQHMIAALETTDRKIACCYSVLVDETNGQVRGSFEEDDAVKVLNEAEALDAIFTFRIGTSVWRRLFHRSVFAELRFPEGEINEEYPLLIPMTRLGQGTVLVQKQLYYYRDRSDSVTGTLHTSYAKLQCVSKNLMVMKQQLEEIGLQDLQSFSLFSARNAYFMALSIEKADLRSDRQVEELYRRYLGVMKENRKAFFSASNIASKDKLLFWLVLKGIYRHILRIRRGKHRA